MSESKDEFKFEFEFVVVGVIQTVLFADEFESIGSVTGLGVEIVVELLSESFWSMTLGGLLDTGVISDFAWSVLPILFRGRRSSTYLT